MQKGNLITLTIRSKERIVIAEGRPVMIQWRSKNKERQGINTALGWIRRGDMPHKILIVHSAFQTWDRLEQEYTAKWSIFDNAIFAIKELHSL